MNDEAASRTRASQRWLRGLAPGRKTWKPNLVAGLPVAISSVPDGMAASVLAGVNPVQGLYASVFGPVGGGLTSSSRLMVITTTSAAALAAGSAVQDVPPETRGRALFLLTLIAGALMIVAGLVRLGRYTRFVPHSVMIGFLTGVAVNMVLGQLPDLLGAEASGDVALTKAWDMLRNLDTVNPAALASGVTALVLVSVLGRTKVGPYASLVALILPSLAVLVAGATSVQLVSDQGDIPQGLPMPAVPHLSDLSAPLVLGAVAVAVLVLIQGAGVSESAPNPDGTQADANQDFVGQGVGNVLSGVFGGQPVGGSVGQTALSVASGARGRWAAIFAGMWVLVILVAFSRAVGYVVVATLAAVLITAAIGSFRTGAMIAILRTSRMSQVAAISTFAATLLLPVAAAVGLGVVLSLLMQVNREALDLRVVALRPGPGGTLVEYEAPASLPSREVLLLDIYGSLFYAGARTVQVRLPDPAGAQHPAVVLRLRGRAMLGSTSFAVLAGYADRVASVGGRFYLSGLDPAVHQQLLSNRTVGGDGEVRVFEASPVIGESSLAAVHDAESWLEGLPPER
jgi:sulfate permease, SulP family